MKKNVNGIDVDLSADEMLAEQQKEAAWNAQKQKEDQDQYKFDRLLAYPSVQDQLLNLWAAMDAGEIPVAKAFYNSIKAVNDKYPAP